jgi:hypothetical protein
VSEEGLVRALRELRDEVRRAIRIYVAFWALESAILFIILAKIAGIW